jgi:hypothetical protein
MMDYIIPQIKHSISSCPFDPVSITSYSYMSYNSTRCLLLTTCQLFSLSNSLTLSPDATHFITCVRMNSDTFY